LGTFVKDLAHGELAEKQVLAHLKAAYPKCDWVKGNKQSKHLDLICVHCGNMVEVKTDRKALETGNLCFESNLFIHTRAHRIFYVVGNRAYVWNTSELLKKLLLLHANGKTRGLLGGDGWRNPMILAPLELITESAEVYELKEEE
jgi:hypothetical protein